jgi:signal peptidase I
MNDDRATRGKEWAESGGETRPGRVNDHYYGPVAGDGKDPAAPGASTRVPPRRPPGGRHVTAGSGQPGTAGRGSRDGVDPGAGTTSDGTRQGGSHRADSAASAKRKKRRSRSWWVELPILLVFALVLALIIKTFVVQAFFIPSSSMENTLDIGDKVLVNKLVYDFRSIHRGDIVVFNGDGSWNPVPAQPKPLLSRLWGAITGIFGTAPGVHDYIKRVIGLPGDHIVCCDALGRITVNGAPLNERSYLYPGNVPSAQRFNIVVPPGRLWVMGDHRAVSYDSRGHLSDPGHGTIPENRVVGRAFMIVAPVSRWRILPIPATFEQPKLAAGVVGNAVALAASPAGPLAAGFVGAVPLTLLERRLRRRRLRRRHARAGPGMGRPRSRGRVLPRCRLGGGLGCRRDR